MTAHSVAELREAWRAIEAGEFAHGPRSAPTSRSAATLWTPAPSERVVAVVGCAGGVGASTVALALYRIRAGHTNITRTSTSVSKLVPTLQLFPIAIDAGKSTIGDAKGVDGSVAEKAGS